MPDEVTLDVTTIEENVTVETAAGDVVEIQVVAPNGTAATVTVGTTTTGAAGTNASVTNSGTTSAAVLNFTIPQGAVGANGGSSTAWKYKAKTNATSGYPTNGHLLWNNATQLSATEILVSHLNDDGSDIELFLSFFVEGQKLFIQNRDDSSQNQIWEITGTPTVTNQNTSTSYYTFPVTLVSSQGAEFNNNHSILFGTITAATNSVTSATTSDGTADLNLLEVSTGVLVVSDSFTLSKEIVSGLQTKMTFTANPTAVGDGQQIIWQWYNGGSPITTAAISSEATGSTTDKLIFKTTAGGSLATSLDLTNTLATFSGSISSLGESYRATSTFTYASGAAAAHRTALGLTTLATTTPGTNVANFLEFPTSANLASALTDENGTGGGFVRAEGATLTSPTLVGTPVFNATDYTYGTGAAAAHRDALDITSADLQIESLFTLLTFQESDAGVFTANLGTATSSQDGDSLSLSAILANQRPNVYRFRNWNRNPGVSGTANAVIPVRLACAGNIYHLGSGANGASFRCGFGMVNGTSAVAADANATTGRGFGWRIAWNSSTSKLEFNLWAHNGTTYVEGTGIDTGLGAGNLDGFFNIIVRLASDGTVSANTWFGSSTSTSAVPSSTPTVTLAGGPTSGTFANLGTPSWIAAAHSTNAPASGNSIITRISNRKLALV